MGKDCALSVTKRGPEAWSVAKKGRIINNSHITQKPVQRVQSVRGSNNNFARAVHFFAHVFSVAAQL